MWLFSLKSDFWLPLLSCLDSSSLNFQRRTNFHTENISTSHTFHLKITIISKTLKEFFLGKWKFLNVMKNLHCKLTSDKFNDLNLEIFRLPEPLRTFFLSFYTFHYFNFSSKSSWNNFHHLSLGILMLLKCKFSDISEVPVPFLSLGFLPNLARTTDTEARW